MSTSIKDQLKAALTVAMKSRNEVELSSIRQALGALSVAETAGAEAVVLDEAATIEVLAIEIRKHHESADAFEVAGRPERVAAERAEAAVLEAYLPAALSNDELAALIADLIRVAAIDGATGMKAMGRVVSAVRVAAGPTADGAQIAALVKAALSA